MATINFSGLASGLNSENLISQLSQIERIPATALEKKKSDGNKRIAILSDISTKLHTLQTRAEAVDTAAELNPLAITTSRSGEVGATLQSNATAGTHTVRVSALAKAQVSVSRSLTSADAGALGTGSLGFTVGDGDEVVVSYGAGDSLAAIASRIESQVEGVSAQVVHDGDGWRLVVRGDATGEDNAVTFTESGDALGFLAPGATKVEAQDARLVVDGVSVHRASNHITDVLPGVTLDATALTADGAADVTLTVAADTASVKDRVQGLVDAYNDVAKVIAGQLAYSGTQKGQDTLFGDSSVQALQRALTGALTTAFSHDGSTVSAAALGIKLAGDGTVTFDAAKFASKLASDPTAVEHLLAGAGKLAATLGGVVTQYTQSGDGVIANKTSSIRRLNTSYDKEIDRIDARVDSLAERLRRQFTAMESAVSALQSQSSYLQALFSSS